MKTRYSEKHLFSQLHLMLQNRYPKNSYFIDLGSDAEGFSTHDNEKDLQIISLLLAELHGTLTIGEERKIVEKVRLIVNDNTIWCFAFFVFQLHDSSKIYYYLPVQWPTQGQPWEQGKVPFVKSVDTEISEQTVKEITKAIEFWWGHLIQIRQTGEGYSKAKELLEGKEELVNTIQKYYGVEILPLKQHQLQNEQ